MTTGRRAEAARRGVVPGTPRWAVIAAHAAMWSVVPSAIWRTAAGVGIPVGWTQEHLDRERIPGFGTVYVITLSVLSIAAASLTIGLVRPWGERISRVVPRFGGRRLPIVPVVAVASLGAVAVAVIVVQSIVHWSSVSGFADRPISLWSLLMLLCYLPAIAWAPLLLAVTFAYFRRRMTTRQRGAARQVGVRKNRGPLTVLQDLHLDVRPAKTRRRSRREGSGRTALLKVLVRLSRPCVGHGGDGHRCGRPRERRSRFCTKLRT